MRVQKIRYIVHPDDRNDPFFYKTTSDKFQEIVAHIDVEGNRQTIEQINDRLTVGMRNKGYIRYVVHPEDESNLYVNVDRKFEEIRVLFNEDEEKETYISQVNNYATVPDDAISSSVYAKIEIKR